MEEKEEEEEEEERRVRRTATRCGDEEVWRSRRGACAYVVSMAGSRARLQTAMHVPILMEGPIGGR